MIETLIQAIVAQWTLDINLYKGYPPQDVDYPFVTFNINQAGIDRTFCSDIMNFSVIFTVYTDSFSSSEAQSTLADIKTLYNRSVINDDVISIKVIDQIVTKDEESQFYIGSSTYLVAVEELVEVSQSSSSSE